MPNYEYIKYEIIVDDDDSLVPEFDSLQNEIPEIEVVDNEN